MYDPHISRPSKPWRALADCDIVNILDEETRKNERVLATGNPLRYFKETREDVERVSREVRDKVEHWFETGEEQYQRFKLTMDRT